MPRINQRLVALILILLFSISAYAQEEIKLELSCNIIFDHYAGIESSFISKDIVLTSGARSSSPAVKLRETNGYEFWATIYSTQHIEGHHLINNFQVSIKQKARDLSVSALSDSVYTPDKFPSGNKQRQQRHPFKNGNKRQQRRQQRHPFKNPTATKTPIQKSSVE